MSEYADLMRVLDENDNMTLYKLETHVFDTVALIVNEGARDEQAYVLTDMQGRYPTSINEISEYDWVLADDVNWW